MLHRNSQIKAKSSCAYQTSPSTVQTWNKSNIQSPQGIMLESQNMMVKKRRNPAEMYHFHYLDCIYGNSLSNSGSRKVTIGDHAFLFNPPYAEPLVYSI